VSSRRWTALTVRDCGSFAVAWVAGITPDGSSTGGVATSVAPSDVTSVVLRRLSSPDAVTGGDEGTYCVSMTTYNDSSHKAA
jgi:hypothetical protein